MGMSKFVWSGKNRKQDFQKEKKNNFIFQNKNHFNFILKSSQYYTILTHQRLILLQLYNYRPLTRFNHATLSTNQSFK